MLVAKSTSVFGRLFPKHTEVARREVLYLAGMPGSHTYLIPSSSKFSFSLSQLNPGLCLEVASADIYQNLNVMFHQKEGG